MSRHREVVQRNEMSEIQPEPTVRSETAFKGNLLTVRREDVQLPNGKTTVREIVDHSDVIAVLPVLDDGQIVLVRQFRKSAERVLLELPAGGIDGDESPEEAVRREMEEETGYAVESLEHLCSFYTSPGYTTEFMHLYRATGLKPGKATEETDQIEVIILPLEEALTRINGEVSDAKSILGLYHEQLLRRKA